MINRIINRNSEKVLVETMRSGLMGFLIEFIKNADLEKELFGKITSVGHIV